MIYLEDISGKIGCSNSNSTVQIKMAIGADDLSETPIEFAKTGGDWKNSVKLDLDSLYAGEHAKNISFDKSYKYQIKPADLAKSFYTDGKGGQVLKRQSLFDCVFPNGGQSGKLGRRQILQGFLQRSGFREKLGSSVKHKYGSESKALDKSGVIKVKIPLKLPDLKVDLKGKDASAGKVTATGR